MVCVNPDLLSNNEPTLKKLWVWEIKYDASSEDIWYSLKDAPGQEGKVMGWFEEQSFGLFKEEE